MTGPSPHTPVIVGAGQITHRERDAEPVDLMSRSAELAIADAGSTALRDRIDAVRVIWGVWPYRDPGRLVAERIGAPGARTTLTTVGGNQVYDAVIDTAARIERGEIDVAVIVAAESLRTRRADKAAGRHSAYLAEPDGAAPDEVLGSDHPLSTADEERFGVTIPTTFYAMAETAIRHRTGETVEAHRERITRLWAQGSAVAAGYPGAWLGTPVDAGTIATVTDRNRPVAAPYSKLMVSNLDVDQAGAIVMCSVATAEATGVARDRWVFPHAGVSAHDHWFVTNRWALDESPAMRLTGTRTLELAGVGHDDCDLIDLYSCFPSAVQLAQRELGISPDRAWTITGGLTFGGGPLNCYCILPLTRSVELLRAGADRALLTGNGGWFSKHSALVLAGRPGDGFRTDDVQAQVDALPSRPTPPMRAATATIETYTVLYDRAGAPERGVLACLADDGTRHWAHLTDADGIATLLAGDACGRRVLLDGDTGAELA